MSVADSISDKLNPRQQEAGVIVMGHSLYWQGGEW